jgi:hypothetical protein
LLPLPGVQKAMHEAPAPQGPPAEQPVQVPALHQRLLPQLLTQAVVGAQGLEPLEHESHTWEALHQLLVPQLRLPQLSPA